jgi:hypothetical protein
MSRPASRETARDLLAQAVIGLDNCTAAEHASSVALRGIGYALLEVADAIRAQSECLANEGVVVK